MQSKTCKTTLSIIAPDPNVVVYGTSADEKSKGLKEIEAQFERDWFHTLQLSWSASSRCNTIKMQLFLINYTKSHV
jgi:hypothetical protein